MEARYNFLNVHLAGSANLAKLARSIELGLSPVKDAHICLAYASASIMLSVAALEAEAWSVLNHKPGYHLGSGGINQDTKLFLNSVSKVVENQRTLERFNTILTILKKPTIDKGSNIYQNMDLVVFVRNEITHYKSATTTERLVGTEVGHLSL